MRAEARSGIEKSVFKDGETGREIWRLTSSATTADRHGYYDINPWSPDGSQIVFSSAPVDDIVTPYRDLLSSNKGVLYLMDAQTFDITFLAGEAFYQTHNGAFPIWHPSGRSVYYNHASGRVAAVDVEDHQVTLLEGAMRQISPDGEIIVWTVNGEKALSERGVYTMRADGTDAKQIISTERIYQLTPNRDQFTPDDVTVGNTKWTPDGQHMLVTIWIGLWQKPGMFQRPGVQRSLYVASRDGSDVRWLTYFGHHHSWTPDGRSVLYCGWMDMENRRDPRLFLVDFDGSNKRVVIDEPLGGHPCMDPTMSRIVTWDAHGIVVVDVSAQRFEYVATWPEGVDHLTHKGTHPHPVWSADGEQVVYNSAQSGHSQLYLIPLT